MWRCFAVIAPTRNTPAEILLSENLPGGFLWFLALFAFFVLSENAPTLSGRQNIQHTFKTNVPTLGSVYFYHSKVFFFIFSKIDDNNETQTGSSQLESE